jgi:hypothetical protein
MDSALRSIPGFLDLACVHFLGARPGSAGATIKMWLNCEGVKLSPHPIWRKKHTPDCKGLSLVIRDLSADPNSSEAVWSTPLVADRFCIMEGLTPAMSHELGRLHRAYADADLAELREMRALEAS